MRLSILLRDGFTALDIVGGYEVLANLPGMDVEFVAPAAGLADPELMVTIQRLHATAAWTVGICNGVEWLGKAGLIEGKEVTTNWACRSKVEAYGARVNTQRFHRDGKLITGAGVSASIDASLFLAGLIAGEEVAKTVQLGIEYYPASPFGNGTPDDAPAMAQAIVRQLESEGTERLQALEARIPQLSSL